MIDRTRTQWKHSGARPVRIGAVNYLNSKPLIDGLAEAVPEAKLILDYPSRLADDLACGRLDVALIPSIEAFSDPEYEVISDACVASRGPVLSVKLYCRTHPGMVRTLALDEGSRTSAALVRIILEEKYGVSPVVRGLPMGSDIADSDADAVLLIGDRAMRQRSERFTEVWDLGETWFEWTGLPFVFALWVTRSDTELHGIGEALNRARDRGVARLAAIAAEEAPALGISPETAVRYLTENLHFRLGSAERSGLTLFQQLAARYGLAREDARLAFRQSSPEPAACAV